MNRTNRYRLLVALALSGILAPTLAGCATSGSAETALRFKEVGNAFNEGDNYSMEECYRTSLLDDNVRRPFARTSKVEKPIAYADGKISGSSENLPNHWYNMNISLCVMSVGAPAVAVADINNDGYDDIIKAPNQVWINDKTGHFQLEILPIKTFGLGDVSSTIKVPLVERWTASPAVADLDNDGTLEVISVFKAGPTNQPFEIYARESGKWVVKTDKFIPAFETKFFGNANSVMTFDYDNDGWLDLGLSFAGRDTVTTLNKRAGFDTPGLMILRNEMGKGFLDVTSKLGIREAVGAVVNEDLWAGSVSKYWEPHTYAHAMTAADLDNDGFTDIFVAGDFGTGMLLWNDGGKRFVADTKADYSGHALMGPALSDVNGDGYLDIFVTQIYSPLSFIGNTPGGRPSDVPTKIGNMWRVSTGPREYVERAIESGLLDGDWGWGAAFADFDLDGFDELIQAGGYTGTLSPKTIGWTFRKDTPILFQRTDVGQAAKTPSTSTPTPSYGTFASTGGRWVNVAKQSGIGIDAPTGGVAVGDFDRDGRLDFVIASGFDSRPVLYKNNTKAKGAWLELTPTNVRGGRQIYGASVKVSAAGREIVKYSGTQSQSFMSNGTATLWFGLGQVKTVDIEVRYPNGMVKNWENVKVDQKMELPAA
jgi:hypothetical protein